MDLKTKVAEALRRAFQPDQIQLVEDDGIYGFVVSSEFSQMSSLDRQTLIDRVLHDPAVKMTKKERRQVLAIAALTPSEYAAHGYGENGSSR